MTGHRQFLALLGLSGAFATATPNITWGPCSEFPGAKLPVQCANLTVPLDYTRPAANETLTLNLVRLPALKKSKGSILLNFGGPGIPGRPSLAGGGETYRAITGGEYDLVSWDPRGTANTLTYSCFDDPVERSVLLAKTSTANESDVALGAVWAQANLLADTCGRHEEARARADIISTPFVARDMMRIVDALGGDRRLRYWGLSYGTILGATVAAMFPDRMERVVLDGVVNPFQYYFGYDTEMLADTDATLAEFARLCAANAMACPLAANNATATAIEASVYQLSEELKYRPIYSNGSIIDYNAFRSLVRFALYSPEAWPALAAGIRGLQEGDTTAAVAATAPPIVGAGDESPFGIHCADKDAPHRGTDTVDPLIPVLHEYQAQSRMVGDLVSSLSIICALWQTPAKETADRALFTHVRTRHPLLFVGNSFDPATPLRSAVNSSSIFEDSVVLEHQGHGHTSVAEPSICTAQAIRDYFNGVVPAPGAKCATDIKPFQPGNWTDLYPKLGYTPPTEVSE